MNHPRHRPGLSSTALALTAGAALFTFSCGAEPGYNPMLLTPDSLTATAPATFRARFETSKGDFVIEVQREWSPHGADRFYNLVSNGYYDGVRFFRVIDGFMAQFGIHGDPDVSAAWRGSTIPDDSVRASNARGFVTFAKTGSPNSRGTQVFINFADNGEHLDTLGFSPFGQVVEGMDDVVDEIHSGYGEGAPRGRGPGQDSIQLLGNDYLVREFPRLDFVIQATIEEES